MISLCVAARNEAQRIPRLLRSVQGIVSEVCLLWNCPAEEEDGTAGIVQGWCRQNGVDFRLSQEQEVKGYPDWIYNDLLAMPTQPWTLLLDADEELTEAGRVFAESYQNVQSVDAWWIPRTTIINQYDGQPLVFNESHPRFFRTGTVRYPEGDHGPHQSAKAVGTARVDRANSARPYFIQHRDAREQLRRDKGRGQYPETPLPPYWQSVPGWFDWQAICDLMVEEARPGGHIVEVGCWLGRSTCYLGQKAKESGKNLTVWAVDHFRGSDEAPHKEFFAQGRNLYAECLRNLDGAGLLDTVRVLPIASSTGPSLFNSPHGEEPTLEGVFIDASHDYNNVTSDIGLWRMQVCSGGILAGHDYSSAWPGVVQAVDEAFSDREIDKHTSPGSWLVRL